MRTRAKISTVAEEVNFLERMGIEKSFLTYHNYGSDVSEYVEIGMPYMILYEALDHKNDRMTALEFTESMKNYMFYTAEEMLSQEPRPLHSHDFYELTIVLSGEVQLQIEDEIVTYHEGECCLCNKNIRHKELHDTDFELVLFMFTEDYIRSVLEQDVFYDEDGKASTKETFFHHLFDRNREEAYYGVKEYIDFRTKKSCEPDHFLGLLNHILLEIDEKRAGRSYMMRGYFCRFIELLGDENFYQIRSHKAKLSKEEALFYRISYLLEKSSGGIGRVELEKELNYSGDYLNRIVKKHTGKTLSEYGRIFLLKEAARLLVNTDQKVGEICEALGYSNRSFFNGLFLEEYGMTPTEYRKSME